MIYNTTHAGLPLKSFNLRTTDLSKFWDSFQISRILRRALGSALKFKDKYKSNQFEDEYK